MTNARFVSQSRSQRALGLVLQRAYNLPADAVRTALTQGLNTEAALQKFEQARKAAAGGIRDETKRAFVTLQESIDGMKKAFQLQAGEAQLKAILKVGTETKQIQESQLSEIKQFNKLIAGTAKKAAEPVQKVIETVGREAQRVRAKAKRK